MIASELKRTWAWLSIIFGVVCFLALEAQPSAAQQLQSPQRGGRGAGFWRRNDQGACHTALVSRQHKVLV